MVRISAFQADGPGSIPGRCILQRFTLWWVLNCPGYIWIRVNKNIFRQEGFQDRVKNNLLDSFAYNLVEDWETHWSKTLLRVWRQASPQPLSPRDVPARPLPKPLMFRRRRRKIAGGAELQKTCEHHGMSGITSVLLPRRYFTRYRKN